MRQALYRNYRPRSFKELLGQEHVTDTLDRAVKNGRISHAYLFTGPRGVGKTSAARILAHVANQLPYSGEATHLDIIEIDAASNRRIDEIRELREKVNIAPAAGKYKVYIIDEVHMLTREAFNALLKTLEEPPAHVIFVLATTEAHKLPETIISRTQRFEFKAIPSGQVVKHLQKIAKAENIDISTDALKLLAEFGGGSFRDSISLLDQLSGSSGPIDESVVRQMLGLPNQKIITDLVKDVLSDNRPAIINTLQELKEQGVDASAVAAGIADNLRQHVINSSAKPNVLKLLKQLIDVPASARPYDYLEICLLEATQEPQNTAIKSVSAKTESSKVIASVVVAPKTQKSSINFDLTLWPKIIETCREQNASLYTALKLAEPEAQADKLLLKFRFPLHQKKLNQSKNKDIIAGIIQDLTGQSIIIEAVVDKEAFKNIQKEETSPKKEPGSLASINNIFGVAEVMES